MVECIACNPNGEYPPHEAHVEVWQSGGGWIPSCCDRVLSWWDTRAMESEKLRKETGAPEKWIRPLGTKSIEKAFSTLEKLVKAGK